MKSSFKNNSPNSDFLMKLGDGSCWSFITTPDTRSWVEKFATVIGLNADDQNKKCSSIRIFFLQRCSEEDSYIRLNPPSYSKIKQTSRMTDGAVWISGHSDSGQMTESRTLSVKSVMLEIPNLIS